MKRADIIDAVTRKVRELGIPDHSFGVRKIPSSVKVDIAIGPATRTVELRSGASPGEVEEELRRLDIWWSSRVNQADLEDVTA